MLKTEVWNVLGVNRLKPLTNIKDFLKRFDDFRNGEFRSIEILSSTVIQITLAGQDTARAFDWISIKIEFSGVSNARLLENTKLSLIDMEDGISIIHNNDTLSFGLGQCSNNSSIKSSTCYIESNSIKYEEGLF